MSRRKEIPTNYLDPGEATGKPGLPVGTVKKTIKADDDIHSCQNAASFLVTVAAEMFIQYLAEQSTKAMQAERKPRKTLQYKDVASAVARIDNLEFLSDVIPLQAAVTEPRETKTPKPRKKQPMDAESKQRTLKDQFSKKASGGSQERERGREQEDADSPPATSGVTKPQTAAEKAAGSSSSTLLKSFAYAPKKPTSAGAASEKVTGGQTKTNDTDSGGEGSGTPNEGDDIDMA